LAEGIEDAKPLSHHRIKILRKPHLLQMAANDETPSGSGKNRMPSTLPSGVTLEKTQLYFLWRVSCGIEGTVLSRRTRFGKFVSKRAVMGLLSQPRSPHRFPRKSNTSSLRGGEAMPQNQPSPSAGRREDAVKPPSTCKIRTLPRPCCRRIPRARSPKPP
jgi:hypothetical protein